MREQDSQVIIFWPRRTSLIRFWETFMWHPEHCSERMGTTAAPRLPLRSLLYCSDKFFGKRSNELLALRLLGGNRLFQFFLLGFPIRNLF